MYLPRLREYVARARADRIDVVHLTTPGPVGLAALYVAWQLQLPMVGSFHTDLAAYTSLLSGSRKLGALMREYMRWPYSRCRRVLAPSHHTRELFIQAKGDPAKVDIWPRGVDTELFSPIRRSAQRRDAWHVADNRPALLYVGRVSREKGLGILPALSRRLHARRCEHRFVIAGEGPMLDELKREMPDAVFTGVLTRDAVAEAFASSELFIFSSRTDTAGNVVLEAQACGVPVLVSDAGGPREYVLPNITGEVCPSGDAGAFGRAAAQLLRDTQRRGMMGEAARQHALSLDWPSALAPLYRAYRQVAAMGLRTDNQRRADAAPEAGAAA
jgi:glycosyltransferase involved in cell wall biosynthesis